MDDEVGRAAERQPTWLRPWTCGSRVRLAVFAVRWFVPWPSSGRGAAPVSVVATVAALLVGSVALGSTGSVAAAHTPHRTPLHAADDSTPNAMLERLFAADRPPLQLPAAAAPPAPAPPTLDAGPPLQPHEIFGFAPWWNLAQEQAFNVKAMTTLAYFSVDINPDGTADESGSGWNGYQSQALSDLVTRAHSANDRVVLTATCFDQHSLDQLASDPNVPARLGATLVQLVSAKNLDGVNIDFEGRGPQDQRGLDNLITQLSTELRAANPHWQVTISTYASSAGDTNGFYDIPGLNKAVDGFFVMAYDMHSPSTPSPNAPLTGPGNSDSVDLAEYAAVVPRSKIILGVPYYGYDWPTAGPDAGAAAIGPASPVTYAQVAAANSASYWDGASQTPWTAYQQGTQWHQVYFDDATSLALKARLANAYHIAGLGVWALGMDGNDPAMLAALLGNSSPAKYLAGPSSTTTTQPGQSSTSTTSPQGGRSAPTTASSGGATSTTTSSTTTSSTTTTTTAPLVTVPSLGTAPTSATGL